MAVIAASLISGSAVGCKPEALTFGIQLHNDTAQMVRIVYVIDGGERSTADDIEGDTIGPGGRRRFYFDALDKPKHCTSGVIVARSEDGREIARIPPPVCFNDRLEISAYAPAR